MGHHAERHRDRLYPGVAVAPVLDGGQAEPGADAVGADAVVAQVQAIGAAVAVVVHGLDHRDAVPSRDADHPR